MKVQRLLLIASMAAVLFSCGNSNNNNNGDWVSKSTFGGQPRVGAVAFALGGQAYVATGFDGISYYNDVWVYNPQNDTWQEIDTIPGQARAFGVAFATANYGYVGAGYNGKGGNTGNGAYYYSDFYQYDTVTKAWTQIASCPFPNGTGREWSTAFGIPAYNMGGVLGGSDGQYIYKDFYTWTESGTGGAGAWAVGNDFKGPARTGAVAWVYQNKAYVVTGLGINSVNTTDFSYFDPTQPVGTRWNSSLRPIGGITDQSYDAGYTIERGYGVAWNGINQGISKGYLTWGQNGGNLTSCWEYDYPTDLWSIKTPFPMGLGRVGGVAVSINDTGYVGLGGTTFNGGGTYFSDWTEFYPSLTYNPDDYRGNQ